jgi:hypothetical protein
LPDRIQFYEKRKEAKYQFQGTKGVSANDDGFNLLCCDGHFIGLSACC